MQSGLAGVRFNVSVWYACLMCVGVRVWCATPCLLLQDLFVQRHWYSLVGHCKALAHDEHACLEHHTFKVSGSSPLHQKTTALHVCCCNLHRLSSTLKMLSLHAALRLINLVVLHHMRASQLQAFCHVKGSPQCTAPLFMPNNIFIYHYM